MTPITDIKLSTKRWYKAVALATTCLAITASADSLITNSSFSSGDDALDNWTVSTGRKSSPITSKSPVVTDKNAQVQWIKGKDEQCLFMESSGDNAYGLVMSKPVGVISGAKYQLSFRYKAQGLMPENGDRTQYAAAILDVFVNAPGKGRVGGCRIITFNNAKGWSTLTRNNKHVDYFTIPNVPNCTAHARLQLVNKYPNNKVKIWWDDIALTPMDSELPNTSFENGKTSPDNWKPTGAAKCKWVKAPAKSGNHAISVTDAPEGLFSGWMTELPVRPDRKYVFSGFVKGGDLNPNGFIGGGALSIMFLDAFDSPLGKPVVSKAVGANTDWTRVETAPAQPPRNAVKARLVAGLNYCNGTAWFDDLELATAKAATQETVVIKRNVPAPCANVKYAKNLLKNGSMEAGKGMSPDNWTYIGKADKDWTKEEIQRFHDKGRPEFSIGRGRGVWSKSTRYAGKRALLNISIDPPLSPNHQWYGRNPVDGYWQSDSMSCQPGQAYIAGGWINPGAEISGAWYGPLLLAFYDTNGRELAHAFPIRCSMNSVQPGEWIWWATQPTVAPTDAKTMRLKFIQELKADKGGWGRTFADNLAVWEVLEGTQVKDIPGLSNRAYKEWFTRAHAFIKPPYTPSPAEALEYKSVWGKVKNVLIGNLFTDPKAPAIIRFKIFNQLGEKRNLKLSILRTDWLGENEFKLQSDLFTMDGYSEEEIELELPPTLSYGAFHLDCKVLEGKAVVGQFPGRYGVMPPLNRPRTGDAVWAVTPLMHLKFDGDQHEMELGELFKIAGFRKSWVRIYFTCSPYETEKVEEKINAVKRECCWYRSLGIKPILQLNPPRLPQKYPRQVDKKLYFKVGEIIGKEFKDLVAAVGNWGIEQANSASPYRGGGKLRVTDNEYDTMFASIHDGIKSVAPDLPVMIGNIATDFNAKTIERLYKAPANGRFEGAFFNAYMGQLMVGRNMIKAFDRHGNTDYTIWSEEQANQRSPFTGDARRYSEADGPKNMVRTWLAMVGKLNPRLKAVTIWGFAPGQQDIMMMTQDLQPRPHYVAHAVMANALADGNFAADLSTDDITIFQWQRGDGPFFVAWANSGKRSITMEVEKPTLTTMDLMGNRTALKAKNGLVTLNLTSMPVYFFGGGKVEPSKRVAITIKNGTVKAGQPALLVKVKNNTNGKIKGQLTIDGTGKDEKQEIAIAPGEEKAIRQPISIELPDSRRSSFRAEMTLDNGAVFATIGEFDFAQAVKTNTPPALDGTWKSWQNAQVIEFGSPDQVGKNGDIGEEYEGKHDLYGKIRMLWDDQNLYLGVEALDNAFVPFPKRASSGFMGDSIEFGIQPNNIISEAAPKYEYECYLPKDDGQYAATRRFPLPSGMITEWNVKVTPTGVKGNVNYQLAIPWKSLDVEAPQAGKAFSLSVVLNDKDNTSTKFSGRRTMIFWFSGVHTAKNPEKYGDVILVEP